MKLVRHLLARVTLAVNSSVFASDEMAIPYEAKAMSEKVTLLVNENGEYAYARFSAEGVGA